jgi:hypothetical protein
MARTKQSVASVACGISDFADIFPTSIYGAGIGGLRIVSELDALYYFRIVAVEGILPD